MHSTSTRKLTTRLTLTFTGLLLTGCASDPEPEPIFAEAEPTTTPAPSADADEGKDPHRSPKALIRHWNRVQNEMQKGDTAEWRALTADCEGCLATADRVDAIYAAGGFLHTDGRSILSIRADAEFPSGVFRVDVDVAPTEYKNDSSAPLEHFPGGRSTYRVYLHKKQAGWQFRDYSKLAQ